jgi:hypothetical protein
MYIAYLAFDQTAIRNEIRAKNAKFCIVIQHKHQYKLCMEVSLCVTNYKL